MPWSVLFSDDMVNILVAIELQIKLEETKRPRVLSVHGSRYLDQLPEPIFH